MKKYELTTETLRYAGHTLHRIKALRDFGVFKAGELGGWIESEEIYLKLITLGSMAMPRPMPMQKSMVMQNSLAMQESAKMQKSLIMQKYMVR